MAKSVEAYFGRETHAFLDKCAICLKPYDGSYGWRTVKGNVEHDDVWWLWCGECQGREREDGR